MYQLNWSSASRHWRGGWKKIEFSIFFNDDDNENENLAPRCRQSALAQTSEMQARLRFLSESSQASKTKSLTSTLSSSLERLMECKAPDGRYLMRHRYQWWAVYHVLVRQCGFPDGYREFVACIAHLFPEGLPLLVQRWGECRDQPPNILLMRTTRTPCQLFF